MSLKMLSVLLILSLILGGSTLLGNQIPPVKHGVELSLQNTLSPIGDNVSSPPGMPLRETYRPLGIGQRGGCKTIMAVGNATAGDYNLLLKVRDPARPGFQVLCSIPKGYEYEYHHPWTGFKMHFEVEHTFIGTTTKGDVPPNITKPGMILSDAGLAFSDADTFSYLINPSRNAWDDFDWMRYAAQSAGDVEEATILLTRDVVDEMHAPSVAENIFVVGSDNGVVIEADAFNYRIRKVEDVAIQSNYPKELWDIHTLYPLFIAQDFNSTFMGWVDNGERIHLGGFVGVRTTDIDSQSITARVSPIGISRRIALGEGAPLGNFWIELLDIQDGKAKIFLCFKYFSWESKLRDIIEQAGFITVKDMMNFSRIHSHTLDELRGMCEGRYEASTIYKIPTTYPQFLSTLWFAADQCSSIFVPVHICSLDIYDPYETGEAHLVALQLLEKYGHDNLTQAFEGPENAFLSETYDAEQEAFQLLENEKIEEAIDLLTLSDITIQTKALLIEKMWLNMSYLEEDVSHHLTSEILEIWEKNHSDVGEVEDAINFISLLLKKGKLNESDEVLLRSIQRNLYSLTYLMKREAIPIVLDN